MKTIRSLIALLLVFATLLCISMPAFAAEPEVACAPESATRNTVEVTVQPGEELIMNNNAVVMPRIWEQQVYNVPYGTTTYTPQFVIPHRYFAYEFSATSSTGIYSSLSVNLIYHGVVMASATGYVNRDSVKVDWINVYANDSYYFQIVNNATTAITVTLTYYSWA